ncbi:hypothetical protein LTR86_006973 [Recurvomyces mirabilis]|nr:hypothetical protein LTR86_006973 [Recurvomyces mirabilis]
MSTFDGVVKEFPEIRIDYFRHGNDEAQPPLAYFLSHVHSDHLAGLETCKSPFIYCSPATREILLRLEKYPHRMNFAKGVLESRKQTYSHLKKLLKPIPLDTPTIIELSPGNSIRVTLLDANHCIGAVCFLVEGNGKAILYTGDVRSEDWWVRSLCRHPSIIPYVPSTGTMRAPIKPLHCVYLDTTFAVKDDMHKHFPTKAEGLSEMLHAVARYPKGTLFYFDSWTFGYEDVWLALSARLGSSIHLDDYRYKLYLALAQGAEPRAAEAAKLIGYHCGNHSMPGSLTAKQSQVHSCEQGTGCDIWQQDFVRITPIITRHNGRDVAELGAGGGNGDLDAKHELELGDAALIGNLITLCATRLQDQPQQQAEVLGLLTGFITARTSSVPMSGSILAADIARGGEDHDEGGIDIDEVPLDRILPILAGLLDSKRKKKEDTAILMSRAANKRPDGLTKQITFPYSRHASYSELCLLINALRPADIHPCTVDEQDWGADNSMGYLFGHLYNDPVSFSHDQMMLRKQGARKGRVLSTPQHSHVSHEEQELKQQQLIRAEEDERRVTSKHGTTWATNGESTVSKRKSFGSTTPDADAIDALNMAARLYGQGSRAASPTHRGRRRGSNALQSADGSHKRSVRRRLDSSGSSNDQSPGLMSLPPMSGRDILTRNRARAAAAAEGRGLHIAGMAPGTTEDGLLSFFHDYDICDVNITAPHGITTENTTYGFVDLATPTETDHAIVSLNRTVLNGERVAIKLSHKPDSHGRLTQYSGHFDGRQYTPSEARLASREDAHGAARNDWSRVGLLSTGRGHQVREEEL